MMTAGALAALASVAAALVVSVVGAAQGAFSPVASLTVVDIAAMIGVAFAILVTVRRRSRAATRGKSHLSESN